MMKLKCLAALAAGTTAFGASAGDESWSSAFLENLAKSPARVQESPCATGGEIVLKLDDAGYSWAHVFTNADPADPSTYGFTATIPLTARILVVGGGGAGGAGWCGAGGGGGAGGMIDTNGVAVAAGLHLVTVGKGGTSINTATYGNSLRGGNGGDSSFGSLLAAIGGGGGGGNNGAGGNGGSGGGAAKGCSVGASTMAGQGFGGGSTADTSSIAGSGGGGAGGPGGDIVAGRGGVGGVGRISDILGTSYYFAGGGAGCSNSGTVNGGNGGGGNGGGGNNGRTIAPTSGEDGLGGGGGGAGDTSSGLGAAMVSGAGGTGIVVVRYFHYTGEAPHVASAEVVPEGRSFLTVSGNVDSFGAGSAGLTSASIVFTPQAGSEGKAKTVSLLGATTVMPVTGIPFEKMVYGLSPNVPYDWTLTVSNDQNVAAVESGSFTLTGFAPAIGGTCVTSNFTADASTRIWEFSDASQVIAFTPNQNVTLRALVVGGGGAGGSGWGAGTGGGGAGGMIDDPSVVLKGDVTYYIAVGAGGEPVLSNNTGAGKNGGNGNDSAIYWLSDAGLTTNYVVRAFGGGGGGGNQLAGSDGASGGGGGNSSKPGGNGVAGQGSTGGGSMGGGGGAGEAGQSGNDSIGGKGGDGLASDILGVEKYFAGGGGGGYLWGSTVGGLGGKGGGGAGGNRSFAATSGEPGTGGGGGAGPDNNSASYPHPGSGGSGIVILRYTEVEPSLAPTLNIAYSDVTSHTLKANVNVTDAGSGDQVAVALLIGESADALTRRVTLSAGMMGVGNYNIDGLLGGRTYYLCAEADNGDTTVRTPTNTVTMADWASFKESLDYAEGKVASSPYATGGDYILHLTRDGYSDYVHVFTSSDPATFTVGDADLTARLLVVGGGGAGGGAEFTPKKDGAGGGAGGFLEGNALLFPAGSVYGVKVGATSARPTGRNTKNGNPTYFTNATMTVNYTALGGGGGGGWYHTPGSGASGGGAGYTESAQTPGSGTDGQGFKGGEAVSNYCGGGGGAGEPGHAAYTAMAAYKRAGDGGKGKASDILGWEQYFAGGGGADEGGVGGLGGGGNGGSESHYDGYSGEDGLGGGGGGARRTGAGGAGGSGIVIVRYTVNESEAPLLRPCSVEVVGGSIAEVSGALADCGRGYSAATVRIVCTPRNAEYPVRDYVLLDQTTAITVDVPFSVQLKGLKYDATYDYQIIASNDSTEESVQSGSFTTYSKTLAPTVTCAAGEGPTGYEVVTLPETFETVYIFHSDATISLAGNGFARLLVVAGGGGGGGNYGGGGGAGGYYYDRAAYLANGSYAIKVGQGGAGTQGWSPNAKRGGNSSFIGGDVAISMTGGGGGSSWDQLCLERDGGSGGGGSGNREPGKGILDQGYDGGSSCGGGGGSAGGGKSFADGVAGMGGAGTANDISGETVVYAAGGGGGVGSGKSFANGAGAPGGADTAGSGASTSASYGPTATTPGQDGTGSGGGGGGNNSKGGDGGDGVVILRFTDYTLAGAEPIVKLEEIFDVAGNSAKLAINVSYAGDDDDVTLAYSWGYAPDELTLGSVEVPHYMGEQVFTVTGLSPNRTYHVKVTATNSAGAKSVVGSFTTLPKFSKPLTCSSSGGTLGYTIDFAEDADHTDDETLTLWVNGVEQGVWSDDGYLTAGAHSVNPFTTEQFGTGLSVFLRSVATDGARVWTNDTATLSLTLQDAVTYKWNKDVAEGDWTDPACWTSTGGMRGWPTVGSTADFTSTACATVHVDRAINLAQVTYSKAGARYVFIGDTDDASVTPTARGVNGPAENQYLELDNLFFWFKHNNEFCVRSGTEIVLRNGAEMRLTKEDNLTWNLFLFMDGGKLTVCDTATFTCQDIQAGKGGELIFENATHSFPKAELGARGSTPLKTVFRGAAPEFKVTGDLTVGDAGANWSLEVPREGYAAAPIRSVDFPKSGNGICNLMIEKKKSGLSRRPGKCDVPLVSASGSIDVSKVVFGVPVTPKGYYYFTDADGNVYRTAEAAAGVTIKGIWYHHLSSGFAVILR